MEAERFPEVRPSGNVVDLAVAVVVGVAFARGRCCLRRDDHRFGGRLITPLIAETFRKSNFNNPYSTVVFFAVVLPLNALMRR